MALVAEFSHACEGLAICYVKGEKVPLLMRAVYLKDKKKIGKVDDVFGTVQKPGIAIQCEEGIKADSFKPGDKVKSLL